MSSIHAKTAIGRLSALLLAAMLAAAAVARPSSEAITPATPIEFTLTSRAGTDALNLRLRSGATGRDDSHFSVQSTYTPGALAGLDTARLAGGPAPVRFALVREPGRFDCDGDGDHGRARGRCRFTPDSAFAEFLGARGIARPSFGGACQMALTGVNRDLVQGVVDARYPTPSTDDLSGLAALGIDRRYVAEMAAHGYRPAQLDELMGLKAVGVTPAYVEGLRRSGYRRLDTEAIQQFRALGVTPAYLADLTAAGYGELAPSDVAQLRALGVDGAYIAGFRAAGRARPSVDQLVRMKALGVRPSDVRGGDRVQPR